MDESRPNTNLEQDQEVATRIKPPHLYKVLLLNDNFTTMEFVVYVLQKFFHKTDQEAFNVMMEVHEKGSGVCGVYSYDVAMTKSKQVEDEAKRNEFPLKCVCEPIESESSND